MTEATEFSYDDLKKSQAVDPWMWAYLNKVKLSSGEFQVAGHEYQVEIMRGVGVGGSLKRVYKKAAQMTFTESEVLRTLHGMIYSGKGYGYPKGVLYLFPTDDDVGEFSKARFAPLIEYNPNAIGRFVQSTDATNIKKIGKSFLYLHGARLTQRIQGEKRDSSKLRSRSVDKVVFDERDLMEPGAIAMALERFSHSTVQERIDISTPTIPGWGIDESYEESDQRVWMIRCGKCGGDTCLELEFPSCLRQSEDGKVYRACRKCLAEIFPRDGRWIPQYPGREVEGYWISQLNSAYVSPKAILDMYRNPPDGDFQEFYNSKLGMAYVNAENKLTMNDVYARCGQDAMAVQHQGPCAMGVDIGKLLNVTVGFRPKESQVQVCYVARVSSFNDVHDIAQRFNVKSAVIDAEPELRKAREFIEAEDYEAWVCDYDDNLTGCVWYEDKQLVKANRTWACDATHALVLDSGQLILPRKNAELEIFAKQVSAPAKKIVETPDGSRRYVYLKAVDHYRHSLNYLYLAAKHIAVADFDTPEKRIMKMLEERTVQQSDYHPLSYGLQVANG